MSQPPARNVRFGDLGPRVASGIALAAVGLVAIRLGGFWIVALAAIGLAAILWELRAMLTKDRDLAAPLMATLLAAAAATALGAHVWGLGAALACLAAFAVAVFALARGHSAWLIAGLFYAGVPIAYAVILRQAEPNGFHLLIWLVAVVIAADVGAYFAGRMIGGPKLWPSVSPGKTWSGAFGGLAAAALAGLACGPAAGLGAAAAIVLSLGAAVASQLGDLLESAVKRHFDVKDSSRLIPGHGGVMDRLDGVVGGLWFLAVADAIGFGPTGF